MKLAQRQVFVTGASGFIGRWAVPALVAEGAVVTVLARGPVARGDLPAGVRVARGHLGDGPALQRLLAGQQVLVHLAYDVRAPAAANLAAFATLLAAAQAAGVGRIVHLSSIAAYEGWGRDDLTEASPLIPAGHKTYGGAKADMERALIDGALPAAILQPTIVYGPGSRLWTDRLAEALLAGGIVLPEPEGACNGVFVGDVARAIVLAAALPDLGRERFILSGPAAFPWSGLLGGYAAILGRGELHRLPLAELAQAQGTPPAPQGGVPLAARISAAARRVIGTRRFERLISRARRLRPGQVLRPDAALLREFTCESRCSTDLARARLGYLPAHDLAAGLAATADYLRAISR